MAINSAMPPGDDARFRMSDVPPASLPAIPKTHLKTRNRMHAVVELFPLRRDIRKSLD